MNYDNMSKRTMLEKILIILENDSARNMAISDIRSRVMGLQDQMAEMERTINMMASQIIPPHSEPACDETSIESGPEVFYVPILIRCDRGETLAIMETHCGLPKDDLNSYTAIFRRAYHIGHTGLTGSEKALIAKLVREEVRNVFMENFMDADLLYDTIEEATKKCDALYTDFRDPNFYDNVSCEVFHAFDLTNMEIHSDWAANTTCESTPDTVNP